MKDNEIRVVTKLLSKEDFKKYEHLIGKEFINIRIFIKNIKYITPSEIEPIRYIDIQKYDIIQLVIFLRHENKSQETYILGELEYRMQNPSSFIEFFNKKGQINITAKSIQYHNQYCEKHTR